MPTKQEVATFLRDFHIKMDIWSILYRDDRGKNTQALVDLEITPAQRNKYVETLDVDDYSEGPLQDTLYNGREMWVFGINVKGKEVYIKITMGIPGAGVICISFHPAEHKMKYPFKK